VVGLPGTGLGGIFYVLLVVWMVVRESWLLVRASSHRWRWRKIGQLGSLSCAILAALWLEGWLLQKVFLSGAIASVASNFMKTAHAELALAAVTPVLSIAPFAVLAALLIGVHATKYYLRYHHRNAGEQISLLPLTKTSSPLS
jgi:hypothetical protein